MRWVPVALIVSIHVCVYLSVMALVLLPAGLSSDAGFEAGFDEFSLGGGVALLLTHSLLYVLAAISFITTSRLAPGHIPLWLYSRDSGDQAYFHNVLQAVEKKLDGSLRFCRKCGAFKPDHAHHSKDLGSCVLTYQHWGFYMNNAIGFYNYKTYLLTLFYSATSQLLSALLLAPGLCQPAPWTVAEEMSPGALPGGVHSGVGVGAGRLDGNTLGEGSLTGLTLTLSEEERVEPLPHALRVLWRGGVGVEYACAVATCYVALITGGCALAWLSVHGILISRGATAAALFRQESTAHNTPSHPPTPLLRPSVPPLPH